MPADDPANFIPRWQLSEAAERANYQIFLAELCDFLNVPRPEPTQADDHRNQYVFEKAVTFHHLDGSTTERRIDLYKRACFILEAKQGSNAPAPAPAPMEDAEGNLLLTSPSRTRPAITRRGTARRGTPGWDEAMLRARFQAEDYARALPISEGWPPFLITVDVGFSFELYADFSLTGKAYLPFPDPRSFRILFSELANADMQARLRAVWTDPHSLDPARRTARVTREIAAKLAGLARVLEQTRSASHPGSNTATEVAEFLTRCIFTSFAESVGLLPEDGWLQMLRGLLDRDEVRAFPQMASSLWQTMNTGGFSPMLRREVLQFNGGLFAHTAALPLTGNQLSQLIDAADSDWKDVEPAIFGTLLERALDPAERHALGAHYTPRAYVERLVIPTLVEPLRDDWSNTVIAMQNRVSAGDPDAAVALGRAFHEQLCNTRVLDPACGSGNFLYVALEHLKRLEGEVLERLAALGETQTAFEHTGRTVDPHQLLGLELNPRAVVIADLVLWIGYLQWHFRTRGDAQPRLPIISNFHNIREADALMTWTSKEPKLDRAGQPVTQWDGKSKVLNLATGLDVPDDTKRKPVWDYSGAARAIWPDADFIIGNPPFIGGKDIRAERGDGYVEALRRVYPDVPDSADYVMYWWQRAGLLTRHGLIRRFGFITTNSITQVFNRRVVAQNLNATADPLSVVFAVPDHPWAKALSDDEQSATRAAAVRIAMTVAERGSGMGRLMHVFREAEAAAEGTGVELRGDIGKIFADLRIGADVDSALSLKSNEGLCNRVSSCMEPVSLSARRKQKSLAVHASLTSQTTSSLTSMAETLQGRHATRW